MPLDPQLQALLGDAAGAVPAPSVPAPDNSPVPQSGASGELDPQLAALLQSAASAPTAAPPPTGGQHFADTVGLFAQHPFTFGTGMLENALGGAGATVGKFAGRIADLASGTPNHFAQQWGQALQYQPRTAAGQGIQALTGQEADAIGSAVDKIPGANTPLGQTLKEAVPEAVSDLSPFKAPA